MSEPASEFVALTNRHTSAQMEYNARIQARYTVINLYLTAVSFLVARIYSSWGDIYLASWDNHVMNNVNSIIQPIACAIIIPAISLTCSLLMKMHDDMMGSLHCFMAVCEMQNDGKTVPGYHSYEPWASALLKTRSWLNYVMICIFIIVCGSAIAEQLRFFSHQINDLPYNFTLAVLIIIIEISLSFWAIYIEFNSLSNRKAAIAKAKILIGLEPEDPFPTWTYQSGENESSKTN